MVTRLECGFPSYVPQTKVELKFCGTVRNSWQVFQGLEQHQSDREKDGQSPTILKGGKVMLVLLFC
jgi:hypothetical protein